MANVWINEFHYDNGATNDPNEFIEIAGFAGTNLAGWKIQLYNGANGQVYHTFDLTGTIGGVPGSTFGFVSINPPSTNFIQNGSPDGIALIDAAGNVVEFLSYEGKFTATNGAAVGIESIDILVSETGGGSSTGSLQRQGTGYDSDHFDNWAVFSASNTATKGTANTGQTFELPAGQSLRIAADTAVTEGNDGTTTITFTVTRFNPGEDVTFNWDLAGLGPDGWATADDFTGPLSGTYTFTGDQTAYDIVITVNSDRAFELNERFSVALSNVTPGVTLLQSTAMTTIMNDDPIPIYQIQGSGTTSAWEDKAVKTTGIITGIQMIGSTRGFYIQDAVGDGNAATSDGIFVFMGSS